MTAHRALRALVAIAIAVVALFPAPAAAASKPCESLTASQSQFATGGARYFFTGQSVVAMPATFTFTVQTPATWGDATTGTELNFDLLQYDTNNNVSVTGWLVRGGGTTVTAITANPTTVSVTVFAQWNSGAGGPTPSDTDVVSVRMDETCAKKHPHA